MRILHISTRLILGGSQENTVLSCEGQARAGHEVHLAFGPIYGPEGSLLGRVERFSAENPSTPIATHLVPNLVREVHPLRDRRALAELTALIARLRPDVVHTHSSKAGILGRDAGWRVLGEARRARAPGPAVLHTIHGPPFMPVERTDPALRRLKTRVVNGVYTLAERRAARRCHTLISVADAMTRQFLDRGIGRPGQYVTVHSGMEVGSFLTPAPGQARAEMRRSLGVGDADVVVGTVARLAQHKGHDDLLAALEADLRARPGLKLLWVGDGWWRGRLLERARSMGLAACELDRAPPDARAQLLLTGLVPPERVPGLVRAMDILAHPSSREGLPRTVPQALLCGVPPVAYDADGTREACIDHVTGRLVPVGDTGALRAAVLALADDPAERRRLADAGRELCRERFSAESMVRHLDEVYARALRLARPGGGGSGGVAGA